MLGQAVPQSQAILFVNPLQTIEPIGSEQPVSVVDDTVVEALLNGEHGATSVPSQMPFSQVTLGEQQQHSRVQTLDLDIGSGLGTIGVLSQSILDAAQSEVTLDPSASAFVAGNRILGGSQQVDLADDLEHVQAVQAGGLGRILHNTQHLWDDVLPQNVQQGSLKNYPTTYLQICLLLVLTRSQTWLDLLQKTSTR